MRTRTTNNYRPDIDGLRAVAILAVLFFHALPSVMPGGFIGVDIFFVISGCVITRLLLSAHTAHTFRFSVFYGRRILRLAPALLVVLLTTLVLGTIQLLPDEYSELGKHLAAASVFSSNLLVYSQVGYFDAPALTKPLLHLWSLGVEWQFYLFFPVLALLLDRRKKLGLAIFGALFAISLALNVAEVKYHPSFVFYLPPTRLWEFLLGAIVAYYEIYGRPQWAQKLPTPPQWCREVMAWIGLLLITIGIVHVREYRFPGWQALYPALGAFLTIAAGQNTWATRRILANRVMVTLGLISYPLYLWHWPLLVYGRMMFAGHSPQLIACMAMVLSIALAWLTYRYVECAIYKRRTERASLRAILILCGCLIAIGLLGGTIVYLKGVPSRFPEVIRLLVARKYADDFQPVTPLGTGNNATGPLIVTLGDSHADHLLPGLQRMQLTQHFRIQEMRWEDCPPSPKSINECKIPNAVNIEKLHQLKPDVVLLSAFWFQYEHRTDHIRDTVKALRQIGVPRIVLVGDNPFWSEALPKVQLYNAFKETHVIPERLLTENPQDPVIEQEVSAEARELGVIYISARALLCNKQGCLIRLNNASNAMIQVDNSHFTEAGSSFFIQHYAPEIFGNLLPLNNAH